MTGWHGLFVSRRALVPNGTRVFLVRNGILRLCGTVYLLTVILDATTANK